MLQMQQKGRRGGLLFAPLLPSAGKKEEVQWQFFEITVWTSAAVRAQDDYIISTKVQFPLNINNIG